MDEIEERDFGLYSIEMASFEIDCDREECLCGGIPFIRSVGLVISVFYASFLIGSSRLLSWRIAEQFGVGFFYGGDDLFIVYFAYLVFSEIYSFLVDEYCNYSYTNRKS